MDNDERSNLDFDLNNKNADWINFRFFKLTYILFIFILWMLLTATRLFSTADCLTVVHMVHGVVNYIYLFSLFLF